MVLDFPQESEEGGEHSNNFVCPLCPLDFSSPDKLISHVYQVRITSSHLPRSSTEPKKEMQFSKPCGSSLSALQSIYFVI